jgi:LmbE family N-acetylglucosaminyl deacetylase
MTKTYHHIYLSPHYDDAALSCGGTIHRQTQTGEPVLVVTVCAAPPATNTSFSPFAQKMHTQWNYPGNVINFRRAEDQTAMGILRADYVWLDFPDCIYRGYLPNGPWFYNNNDQLFGQIHPDDQKLAQQIGESLNSRIVTGNNPIIYAPLSVGHHVDHQLVHAAAWQLYSQGQTIMFYEDYPYVDTDKFGNATLNDTLAGLEQQQKPLKSHLEHFADVDLKAKIKSINAYASQIDTLFGNQTAAAESIRRYAVQLGGGQPAERFWTPP